MQLSLDGHQDANSPAPEVVSVSTIHHRVGCIGDSSQESVAICYVPHPGVHVRLNLVPAEPHKGISIGVQMQDNMPCCNGSWEHVLQRVSC